MHTHPSGIQRGGKLILTESGFSTSKKVCLLSDIITYSSSDVYIPMTVAFISSLLSSRL